MEWISPFIGVASRGRIEPSLFRGEMTKVTDPQAFGKPGVNPPVRWTPPEGQPKVPSKPIGLVLVAWWAVLICNILKSPKRMVGIASVWVAIALSASYLSFAIAMSLALITPITAVATLQILLLVIHKISFVRARRIRRNLFNVRVYFYHLIFVHLLVQATITSYPVESMIIRLPIYYHTKKKPWKVKQDELNSGGGPKYPIFTHFQDSKKRCPKAEERPLISKYVIAGDYCPDKNNRGSGFQSVHNYTVRAPTEHWCITQAFADYMHYNQNKTQKQIEGITEILDWDDCYGEDGPMSAKDFVECLDELNIGYHRVVYIESHNEIMILGRNIQGDSAPSLLLFEHSYDNFFGLIHGPNWDPEYEHNERVGEIGHVAYVYDYRYQKKGALPTEENQATTKDYFDKAQSILVSSAVVNPSMTAVIRQDVAETTLSLPYTQPIRSEPVVSMTPTFISYQSGQNTIRDVQYGNVESVVRKTMDLPSVKVKVRSTEKYPDPSKISQQCEDYLVDRRKEWGGMNWEGLAKTVAESRLVDGLSRMIFGNVCGLAIGAVETVVGVGELVSDVEKFRSKDHYGTHVLSIKYLDNEQFSKPLIKLVDHGLYQGRDSSVAVSKSRSNQKYRDSFRLFGMDMTFDMPRTLRRFGDLVDVDLPERFGVGNRVDWYPSSKEFIIDGHLLYLNCGPLHPKTCYNVWRKHSSNDPDKLVGILWDNTTDVTDGGYDNFLFPDLHDRDGDFYYSWDSRPVMLYSSLMDDDDIMDRKVITMAQRPRFCGRYTLYFPIRQQVTSKNPVPAKDIDSFVLHRHTKQVTKGNVQVIEESFHYCLPNMCVGGNGSRIDQATHSHVKLRIAGRPVDSARSVTHGIVDQFHGNILTTLMTGDLPSIYHSTSKLVMTAAPHLHPNVFNSYVTAYIRLAEFYKTKGANSKITVTRQNADEPVSAIRKAANECLYYHSRARFPRINCVITEYERGSIDYDDMLDCLYEVLIKLPPRQKSALMIDGDVNLPACYTARKSRGKSSEFIINKEVQCKWCRGYAPSKYKWVRGYCEDCSYRINNVCGEIEEKTSHNLHYLTPNDGKLHYLNYPIPLAPANPYYKPKPLLKDIQINSQFRKRSKVPGFKRSEKKKPVRVSNYSSGIGVMVSTRARVLNTGNPEVEEGALRTRIFAQPLDQVLPGQFEKLFRLITRLELIGKPNSFEGAMPFCKYDFSSNGYVWSELKNFKLVPEDRLQEVLISVKTKIDYLDKNVWKVKDWNEDNWISTFEPRKRKLYWAALLKYNPSDPIKITFSFFLKRELDTHGCELNGRRRRINPRIICNPLAISQIIMGPIMRKSTMNLHKILHVDNVGTYFGGLTPGEANRWARMYVNSDFGFQIDDVELLNFLMIENDFSKFDTTYTLQAFLFVLAVYRFWGLPVDSEEFKAVWRDWMQPEGKFSSGTLVRAPIMNASGRSDTALMNALINYYVQLASYLIVYTNKDMDDITLEDYQAFSKICRIAVLGDDSLTLFPAHDGLEERVSKIIGTFGFEARDMKTHVKANTAVFLGNRLYPVILEDGTSTVAWGPTIGRRLFKMGTSADIQLDPLDWLKQTSLATVKMAGFVPFLGTIARRCLQLTDHVEVKRYNHYDDLLKFRKGFLEENEVKLDFDRIGQYMLEVYGISQEEYVRLEIMFSEIESVPVVVTDVVIDRLVTFDTCGG